jgi:signal transduction histidine kinase
MSEALSKSDTGRELIGETPFSVSARVAMQLGRESISSSVTAILELVKNAYDADADVVRIRFANLGTTEAMMVIEDDGEGMSADKLRDHWMVIGTANKTQVKKSPSKGRVLTGEKGLGRLGLDRLCGRTRVQSVTLGADAAVELDVDWLKYEVAKSRLEEVAHPLYRIPNVQRDPVTGETREYPKGTRLILDGLKDRWDEPAIAELHGELSLLISPFHTKHDFRVELDTGRAFTKFDGVVAPDSTVLENAYWKVIGEIDENGVVEMRMSSRLHEMEFHPQPVPWADFAKGEGEVPKSGPLRFEFYFFHRGELDAPGQSLTLPRLTTFLKSNQGVRIYRDGFRVKPYGEPSGEGDWLRLGFRRTINPEGVKQKGNWKLGYNQVVGAVFLTREKNGALIDQTNREGLVMGEAFRHLYIFADKVLTFFEKQHQKFERSRSKSETGPEDTTAKAKDSAAAAEGALRELGELTLKIESLLSPSPDPTATPASREDLGQNFGRVNQTLARTVKALEESVKQENTLRIQTEREKSTLANLASLGILAACFGHETCGWTRTVQANAGWLSRNLKKHFYMVTPSVEDEVLQVLTDIGTDSKRLETFAAFALGNVRPDKRRQREFCLKKLALEVFAVFGDSLQHQKNIEVDLSDFPPHECLIRAYLIDWECIFANLITNAMWGITRQQGARKIRCSITENAAHFTLIFDDSGCGLEAGTEEQVFDAGFSTKRNNRGEQEGTGMGLYIVKSFVEENTGGTIRAVAKGHLGGASFVITVPKVPVPPEVKP